MKLNASAIDLGNRARPTSVNAIRWTSMGVSMARDVVNADFSGQEHEIPLLFQLKTEALKNSVQTYLNDTVKNGGSASVTLDSGDDLGVQALGTSGGTVALVYVPNSFRATHVVGTKWDIYFSLRYYA